MAAYNVIHSTTEKKEVLSFLGQSFTQTWQHQMKGWAMKEPDTLSEQISHYFNVPMELLEDIRHLSSTASDWEIQEILTELSDYENTVAIPA